jgi:TonB-linked SusC/RagA family outer membrane protein
MKKIVSLATLLLFSMMTAFAQVKAVTGKVIDEKGLPVVSASIVIRGGSTGSATDANGRYSISAKQGDVLVISSVGFQTTNVTVTAASTVADVTLRAESQNLGEVVVTTALGQNRSKRSLGYSAQTVAGSELNKIRATDISAALAGKVSGLQVLGTPSSNFGEGNVRIRGSSSLTGGNPIYVVDGTVVNLNAINMDDVETLTVLKGPSATAIYGFRGANGVILITTKQGGNKKPTIKINSLTEVGNVMLLPKYQNEYGGGYSQDWATFAYNPSIHPASWAPFNGQKIVDYGADESWGPKMDGTPHRSAYSWYPGDDFGKLTPFAPAPNSVEDFYTNSIRLNNNIVFEGGSNAANFRMSYNNRVTTLPFPNTQKLENIFSFRGGINLTSKLTATANINYLNIKQKGDRTEGYTNDGQNISQNFNQWWQRQIDTKQLKDYKNPAGGFKSWNIRAPNDTRPAYWDNIYYQVYESVRRVWQNRIYGDVALAYQFTTDLKASVTMRQNILNYGGDGKIASGGLELDRYNINNGQTGEYNQEFLVEYKHQFGDFGWNQSVGGNRRQDFRKENSSTTAGGLAVPGLYSITASKDRPVVANTWSEYKINSLYARGTFSYKNYLFLDYSLRNDWSSALPENENSYLYPSVSLSFVFTDLMKSGGIRNVLDYGKLRAAYGRVGSDLDPYQLAATYGVGTPYGTTPTMGVPTTVYDPLIKASLSSEYEFGGELQFFKRRLGIDFSWYKKDGKDQIIPLTTTPSSGSSSVFINAGLIRSSGWDLILNGTLIERKDFRWTAQVNLATNKSEVINLDTVRNLRTYSLGTASFGPSVQSRVGEKWGTFVGRSTRIDKATGLPVINSAGVVQSDPNMVLGYALPDYTGGLLTTLEYKRFSFSTTLSFQKGGKFFSTTKMWLQYSGLHETTVGNNDKGFPQRDPVSAGGGVRVDGVLAGGAKSTVYVDAQTYYGNMQTLHDRFMMDASFVKMSELKFGYDVPISKTSKSIKSLNLSLFVRNPWLIYAKTKDWGIDPSELENSNSFYEGGQMPPVRSFGLNASIGF